ncbi:hypothetical protein HDU99_006794, partial [Rhizoclosmatium hyalinum]
MLEGIGEHFSALLKFWGVSRVALIVQNNDDMSYYYGRVLVASLRRHNIDIVAHINIPSKMSMDDLKSANATLRYTDARYIILSGQSLYTSSILYHMGKMGFRDSKYVWLTVSPAQMNGDPIQ